MRWLRAWLIRRRFNRLVADFDRRIAEARRKHKPVREIVRAKRQFVHRQLAGTRT